MKKSYKKILATSSINFAGLIKYTTFVVQKIY